MRLAGILMWLVVAGAAAAQTGPVKATQAQLGGHETAANVSLVEVSGSRMEELLIDKVLPTEYPAAAEKKGVHGTVTMKAMVGADGLVKSVEAVSGPEELRASALAAAKQWKFKPYLLDGTAREVTTTLTITFELGS